MPKINELTIEKNNIIRYLTDKVDGLGYEERTIHQATKDLFIKSDLMQLLRHSSNIANYKHVLKEYFDNSEDDFYEAFKQAIKDELNKSKNFNVAFLLNKTFYFKGKSFVLFHKKNILSPKNCSFKDNIFSVISEYTQELKDDKGNKLLTFRPDLIFFLNGIYFSYLELKFLTNGQNATDGVDQIIDKFYNGYSKYEELLNSKIENQSIYSKEDKISYKRNKKIEFKKDFLRIFYSPIYVNAFDSHNLYILRTFNNLENTLKNIKIEDRPYKQISFFKKARKEFKIHPKEEDWKLYIKNLYSKDNIEREILYYNMSEKNSKSGSINLISPRPKQKYGVDKTISLIKEILDNENNENYWINKTKEKIKNLPEVTQKDIIEKHSKFKNNKYIDSILLAYAAGFGKTNIIGWLSLLIKDIARYNEETKKYEYSYNTIFLITDRLELKEQIEQKMGNMNIEKGLVKEVKKSKDFKDIINNNTKIVIINIQKFTNIKKLFNDKEIAMLQNQRSVFIIDEIHRSNSGSQHTDMMSMFSLLFNQTNKEKKKVKKNLLIGLTATPSEETLLRFGEYAGCDGQGNIIYKPHDSFSMIESINEGFTLPFHMSMTPIAISMEAIIKSKNITNSDEKEKIITNKSSIYENKDRIKFISKKIVYQLFNNVYRKIYVKGGAFEGKAMLACYSIEVAIKHHKYIKDYIKQICDEKINNPKISETEKNLYRYYKNIGVYIVYSDSDNKSLPKASKLNDNKSEKTVINEFKNNRNGIIIVVDKLQTGFDEKKLHTLFLNTEKTGIGLIQLLSRVNRTYKGKNECHIIDFSHNNRNTYKHLKEAWKKYSGEIFSNTDLRTPLEQIEIDYNILIKDKLFCPFKKKFIKYLNNPEVEGFSDKIIELEHKICEIISNKDLKKENDNIKKAIFSYFHNLQLLDNIIEINDKYKDNDFKTFFKKILNLFNECKSDFNGSIIDIDYLFKSGGEIVEEDIDEQINAKVKKNNSVVSNNKNVSIENIISIFNEKELLKEEKIEDFDKWTRLILNFIEDYCQSNPNGKYNINEKINENAEYSELLNILNILILKAKRRPQIKQQNIPSEFFNILLEFKNKELLEYIKQQLK